MLDKQQAAVREMSIRLSNAETNLRNVEKAKADALKTVDELSHLLDSRTNDFQRERNKLFEIIERLDSSKVPKLESFDKRTFLYEFLMG